SSDAAALASHLRGLRVKVNLIPMNTVEGTTLRAPSAAAVDAFQQALVAGSSRCSGRGARSRTPSPEASSAGPGAAAPCYRRSIVSQGTPTQPTAHIR